MGAGVGAHIHYHILAESLLLGFDIFVKPKLGHSKKRHYFYIDVYKYRARKLTIHEFINSSTHSLISIQQNMSSS